MTAGETVEQENCMPLIQVKLIEGVFTRTLTTDGFRALARGEVEEP